MLWLAREVLVVTLGGEGGVVLFVLRLLSLSCDVDDDTVI